jgi:phage baseplate assembly protein gpV
MSFGKLAAAQKRAVAGQTAQMGAPRCGLVTSFNPATYRAKVALQPDGQNTGWLPVLSQWVGAGWGMVAPLQIGDQVLVLPESNDAANGVIVGRYFSDVDTPPNVAAAGEIWLVHASGSSLALKADGSVDIVAPNVNVTGTLNVSGDVVIAGKSVLNHYHPDVQLGGSNTPPMQG